MVSLRRHQLAYLSDAGWADVLDRPWDEQACACLEHWAVHRLPLVVTQQAVAACALDLIALGLPAPTQWGRRRLLLQAPRAAVLGFDEFPCLAAVQGMLARSARDALSELLAGLSECRAKAYVFGSYGWQVLSGLDHLRRGSDLDVWVTVDSPVHADAIAKRLQGFVAPQIRLDGELMFGNGVAVAWREWVDWRAGCARAVMVKHLAGVALAHEVSCFECAAFPALAVSA